jgi:dihydroxyacid dehydratase/phosphogluconate dehydratase
VNQFQVAGGPGFVIRELLDAGFMHADVLTVRPGGVREFTRIPSATEAFCLGKRQVQAKTRPLFVLRVRLLAQAVA